MFKGMRRNACIDEDRASYNAYTPTPRLVVSYGFQQYARNPGIAELPVPWRFVATLRILLPSEMSGF